jgi:hypothetical protein
VSPVALARALACAAFAFAATPSEARFLQVDPVGYQDQINLYEYVGDDPLNHNDPTGQESGSTACMFGACNGPQSLNIDPQTARAGLVGMVIVYTGGIGCAVGGCEAALGLIGREAGALKTAVAIERQAELTSAQRAVRSLERNVAEHEEKLAAYKRNPEAFDNKGTLRNAPSPEVKQNIINGRIKALEGQLQKNQGELVKAQQRLKDLTKDQ